MGLVVSRWRKRFWRRRKARFLPLLPYLDTLRWLFIALALGGIALAVWARIDDWKKGLR